MGCNSLGGLCCGVSMGVEQVDEVSDECRELCACVIGYADLFAGVVFGSPLSPGL